MIELFSKYKRLNLPGKLIAINIVAFLLTQLYNVVLTLGCVTGYHWQDYLALHSNLQYFAWTPWTIVTYMFVHADLTQNVFHLLFNMLWLYWFGAFFLRWHTGRQFLGVYLLGGIVSGAFFLVIYNLFPYFVFARNASMVVGASGAIFALIVAVAMRQPNEEIALNFIFFRYSLKMKWFATAVVALTFFSMAGPDNQGGYICHIGGALFGFLFGYLERRGIDLTRGFNAGCDKLVNLFKPHPKMKVHRGGVRATSVDRQKDMDYNTRQRANEAQIDAILDKMRKGGYNALSEDEKRTLFDAGKK